MKGRIVRVHHRMRETKTLYAVALADSIEAIDLMKRRVGWDGQDVDDLGPINDDLIVSLGLKAGDFRPI